MRFNNNRWRIHVAFGLTGVLLLTGVEMPQAQAAQPLEMEKTDAFDLKSYFGEYGLHKITIPDDYYDEVVEDDSDLALDDDIGEDNPSWEDYEQELQDQQKKEEEEDSDSDGEEDAVVPDEGYFLLEMDAAYVVTVSDITEGEVAYKAPLDGIANVLIPANVTIGNVVFKVTSVAPGAFKNNKKIAQVSGGSQIVKIGNEAFSGCTKLKKVTLGSKVKKIGKKAFSGCGKLKNLTIKTKKLNSSRIGSNAFKSIPKNAVVKVPKTKLKAYTKLFVKKGLNKKVKLKAI